MVFILKMRRNSQKIFNENTSLFLEKLMVNMIGLILSLLCFISLIIIRCPVVLFPIAYYILLQGKFLI